MAQTVTMTNADDQVVGVDHYTVEDYRRLRAQDKELAHLLEAVDAAAPQLHPGDLFQVQDSDGTWHAAAVGPGVLCGANRDFWVQTVSWDYGTDRVDCPAGVCRFANGRL